MDDFDNKESVAPEGWEDTIRRMKKHPEIDNPWALAWHMKNKGYTPSKKAFEITNRVAQRFAMEFPSEDALNKYLEDHPKADKSKHRVNPDKKPSRKEKAVLKERDYQNSDEYKNSLDKKYYPQNAPKGMEYPKEMKSKLPSELHKHVMSMVEEDLDKEASYNHPTLKKFKSVILKRLRDGEKDEVEKEMRLIEDLRDDFVHKSHDAKSDAEKDPFRFAGRKLYHAWQAYNDAFYDYHQSKG